MRCRANPCRPAGATAALHAVVHLVLAAALLVVSCAAQAQAPLRVLFVGNSYTYTNRLPDVVAALAGDQHVEIDVEMLAKPDFALSDHLDGRRLAQLMRDHWDWIVLQQGPSNSPRSRRDLVHSVRRIAKLAPAGTRLALMSAWPQEAHADTSPAAEQSYREAASATGACVFPVATAWRLAAADPSPPALYQGDQLHPTMAGTWLAAITILDGMGMTESSASAQWAEDAARKLGTPLSRIEGWARAATSQEPLACRPETQTGALSPTQSN